MACYYSVPNILHTVLDVRESFVVGLGFYRLSADREIYPMYPKSDIYEGFFFCFVLLGPGKISGESDIGDCKSYGDHIFCYLSRL